MLLVIQQKCESRSGGKKKTNHTEFSKKKKTNIFYLLISTHTFFTHIRNVRFSENLACLVFLLPSFWDSPFCFMYYRLSLTFKSKLPAVELPSIFLTKRKATSSKQNNLQYYNTLKQDLRNCFILEGWGVAENFTIQTSAPWLNSKKKIVYHAVLK